MPVGGYQGSTFGDLIERTYRRLLANQREQIVVASGAVLNTDTAITFAGPAAAGVHPGSIVALEDEKVLVTGTTPNNNAYNWTVLRAFQGSTAANHADQTVGILDPKYDRFDIGVAINDALNYLSSPTYGMFAIQLTTVTYNPVFRGYDLSALPSNFIDIREITYDTPDSSKNFPTIGRGDFKIRRGITNAKIPSSRALILDVPAYPGLAVNIAAAVPFTNLILLTDDVITQSGLPATAIDIPSLCAEIDLSSTRDIKRNFIEAQPDSRTATEVPFNAMTAAVQALVMLRDRRIAAEADRLHRLWPGY